MQIDLTSQSLLLHSSIHQVPFLYFDWTIAHYSLPNMICTWPGKCLMIGWFNNPSKYKRHTSSLHHTPPGVNKKWMYGKTSGQTKFVMPFSSFSRKGDVVCSCSRLFACMYCYNYVCIIRYLIMWYCMYPHNRVKLYEKDSS